jgi:hypothetical protein
MGSLPKPMRLPRMMQSTSADQPEVMCTTVPPAKSIALMPAFGIQRTAHEAGRDQTMWAKGK